ncbi:MAG: hypothetical protein H6626_00590 [Pseudobdellovibrionaceae bacterium]|nr:MAG: hypothetical protein H6626_00590 [Pseudobdellovibrionaceae bacterium]
MKTGRIDKIEALYSHGGLVYHTGDLANLWGVTNENTLYTTIKRYCQKGVLHRIQKGMYSIKPLHQLDPWLIGVKALHRYAYVSTETVLVEAGVITQIQPYITIVSSLSTEFEIAGHHYKCRQLQDRYLYQSVGIEARNGVNVATPQRALSDLLYFNPQVYLDDIQAIKRLKVKALQKEMGYRVSA